MKTTTLDKARRGVFPPEFNPGDTFERVLESADRIVFVRLKPGEVTEGSVRKSGKRLMLDTRPRPAAVQAAIRADRDK